MARLHIGLEDPADLIADLEQAFGVMRHMPTGPWMSTELFAQIRFDDARLVPAMHSSTTPAKC